LISMSEQHETVTRRRPIVKKDEDNAAVAKGDDPDVKKDSDGEDVDSKETRLTLMEEVLLLGLKDKEVRGMSCQFDIS